MTPEGLVIQSSAYSPAETMDRLVAAVLGRGMTVFARIDHAAGAQAAGMALRPTELLVFGHAKGGTPLMQAAQTVGIDLPLKVLCWRDAAGVVQLGYNDPLWLARRHGVEAKAAAPVQGMSDVLAAVARDAGSP